MKTLLLLVFTVVACTKEKPVAQTQTVHDTVVVTDTVRVPTTAARPAELQTSKLKPNTKVVTKYDTVTVTKHDTVRVASPSATLTSNNVVDRNVYDRCVADKTEAIRIASDLITDFKSRLNKRAQ